MSFRAGALISISAVLGCAAQPAPSAGVVQAPAPRVLLSPADVGALDDGTQSTSLKSGNVRGELERRSHAQDPLNTVVAVGRIGRYTCSGMLIAPRLVLTARHCLPAAAVLFGDHVERALAETGVVKTIAHPRLDVALLVLDREMVMPIQARRRSADAAAPNGLIRAVGFGASDRAARKARGDKTFADFMVSGWGCDGSRTVGSRCDPRSELVIPTTAGKDTCRGDSGGPVFEIYENRWRLIAMTSRSLGIGRTECGQGGIYTRVDVLDEWIRAAALEEQQ